MKRAVWASIQVLLAFAVPAQDLTVPASGDEAIFGAGTFDKAVEAGQASEDTNKLVWLAGLSLTSDNSFTVPAAGQTYGSQSLFTGKGFLKATKPETGSFFVSYLFDHTLWASSNDATLAATYGASSPNSFAPSFLLSETYLSFDFGKLVFVRLGSQLVDWGVSAVWNPADFINRKTQDLNATVDTRQGKPGLRIHVPFPSGNLFLFGDASRSISSGVVQDLSETGTLGFKVDDTILGWNMGVVGNFGQTSDPRLGLTVSGAAFGLDLWGEGGTVLPLANRSYAPAVSVGGEKTFGLDSEFTFRAETFWNPTGHGDTVLTGAALTGFTPFYFGQNYAYAEFLDKKLAGTNISGSLAAVANVSDASYQATASLGTTLPKVIPLTFYVQYNGGPPNREFTLSAGNSSLTLGIRSVLEF